MQKSEGKGFVYILGGAVLAVFVVFGLFNGAGNAVADNGGNPPFPPLPTPPLIASTTKTPEDVPPPPPPPWTDAGFHLPTEEEIKAYVEEEKKRREHTEFTQAQYYESDVEGKG